jgi:hypothetical protein
MKWEIMSFQDFYYHFDKKDNILDHYLQEVHTPSVKEIFLRELFEINNFHEFFVQFNNLNYFIWSKNEVTESIFRYCCAIIHLVIDLLKMKY